MAKVLVVDDEKLIVKGIRFSLEQDGFEVACAYDGEEALQMAKETEYDMVLLDVMLPKLNGFEVCQAIREFSEMPIIMLTAKGDDMDKILGLEYGADDYITKPFQQAELLVRIRCRLRRYLHLASPSPEALTVGGITLDDDARAVTVNDEPVSLTPLEYDILKFLMQHPCKVFSPQEIYRQVWREPPAAENSVAVHIRHIREKIEVDPSNPRYVTVVWGKGYKIEAGV